MLSRVGGRRGAIAGPFSTSPSERGVTVSASPRSPVVNLVAFEQQVTLSATLALRISRTAWRLRSDHLCHFAL